MESGRVRAEMGGARRTPRSGVRAALLATAILALLVAVRALGFGARIAELRGWIETLGPWGPVVYAGLYGLATALAVPASLLTVAAGTMFGSLVGVAAVSAGATLGAALAFLLARFVARPAVERWLAGSERFARLDALTERHGAIVVAITRLVPLFPFNLLNYGFGLTRVPFGTYLFWSWLCMLPGTVLYVVGGDAVGRALAEGRIPWLLVGVVIGTGFILALLVRRARSVLAERESAQRVEKEREEHE